ncbi:PLP-dependent aminotransferase family protein [Acinetobacter qingfengensis]|uniref:DNA-binding protein n=1 Tax=Acinetobacter qingfengensis TaxID=1262585 RepID=A0A1E7RC33_9GAMM|nr:PLP-dependent aminotransferase family protein [Acinetobacter qingfengensis]KAA8734839.1 PLP-dependent aminotransferase family protein [Acinetobacter qingfengensis]OEY96881.1 DNA-binding protein [Acinetobacter qingfengensis]
MARTTQIVDLPFINKVDQSAGHIRIQLIRLIREAVYEGQLHGGDVLPSSRVLAKMLGIARATVIEAYEQLLAEGILVSYAGKGTYISQSLTTTGMEQHSTSQNNTIPLSSSAVAYANILKEFKPLPAAPFAVSVPVNRTQPQDIWRKFGNRYRAKGAGMPSGYQDPQGVNQLREVIADYVRKSRSVQCDAEQIIITNGIQQALYICSQILFEHQDQVWVEDPAYRGTTASLQYSPHKIQMIHVPVDEEGIQVDQGIQLASRARAAFVTPSHQYPLGMPMSLARRHALLAWAKQQNAWIIEDDYDSEFRYSGQPFPALQGLDPERVIYLGTFSKVLFPSLRLGYAIVPKQLVAPFCGLRTLMERYLPTADQYVLAEFIRQGYLERHIRRIRNVYAEKRRQLIEIIHSTIPVEFAWLQPGDQGMHMVLWLANGINDIEIAKAALAQNIALKAVSTTFSADRQRSGLIIGLGDFDRQDMQQAIDTIKCLLLVACKS